MAAALEREHLAATEPEVAVPAPPPAPPVAAPTEAAPVHVRHYALDGSTFLDDEYVIKGVAGRLLWKVLDEHVTTGRTAFTNREARLDPALELPAFRDNFESRLLLLKRRLQERDATVQLQGAGRGRFELVVRRTVRVERIDR